MLRDVTRALNEPYYGVSLKDWLITGGIAISVAVVLRVMGGAALRRTRRWAEATPTKVDDLLVTVLSSLKFLFLLAIGVWIAAHYIELSKRAEQGLRVVVSLITLLQIGISVQAGLKTFASSVSAEKGGEARTMAA
ncbi:MAG TPA: hypothetical protein VFQ61_22855, partial [Polyangiaceae bacterium]|nr:hypothetical protein [Polyangiaceae bacterium]